MTSDSIVAATRHWLEHAVIGLNLCLQIAQNKPTAPTRGFADFATPDEPLAAFPRVSLPRR